MAKGKKRKANEERRRKYREQAGRPTSPFVAVERTDRQIDVVLYGRALLERERRAH